MLEKSDSATPVLRRLHRNALLLLAVFSVGALLWGIRMALSVLAGGGLALLNFAWLCRGIDHLLHRQGSAGALALSLKYLGRLILIFGALFAMILTSFLSWAGALVGLSIYVVAGMGEAVRSLGRGLRGS